MLTERGKPDYPLPDDFGHVIDLAIDDKEKWGYSIQILVVRPEAMAEIKAKHDGVLGLPNCATVADGMLWLFPTPDTAYPILARYQPQPKTF